ncbi:MAG TPA: prepilin-type N-terminal cleavage/methylation domain-containing protein [Candidatus Colwellbacteria bacterium]|nr:prepilin-type N-terminal cleavage/methylation domain-containing protein [Candidatus Colwellbacteria bacterium]HQA96020.1 prepilin-type N-terminal cleavage/methylation domain-containing protein [Candidatus Colwellbacteria bacterium]
MFHFSFRSCPSFTLIEVLVVIGILGVLTGITVVVLNPSELLASARDTTRLSDLETVNKALFLYTTQKGEPSGNPNLLYLSLPDTNSHCASYILPTLPSPYEYSCVTEANLRKVDGFGWIPVNLSSIPGGSPLAVLPVDPTNNSSFYYTYITGGSYELLSLLESENHLKTSSLNDKGYDPVRFEIGTNLSLWNNPSGLVGYWPLEGSGTVTNGQTLGLEDRSGRNNHGTASNANGSGMSFVQGKVGSGIQLDAVDDGVDCGNSPSVNLTTELTITAWVKFTGLKWVNSIVEKGKENTNNLYWLFRGDDATRHQWTFEFGNGINRSTLDVNETINVDQWYFVAATFNNGNIALYRNDALVGSKSTAITYLDTTGYNAWIGRYSPGGHLLNGAADEVRLYSRALSVDEIGSLYKSGK